MSSSARSRETCKKFKVDRVLIEDKASGHPVSQKLRRRGRVISDVISHNPKTQDRADFGVQLITPEGDKVARMLAVQNLFECGLICAPAEPTGNGDYLFKDWADKVITECVVAGTMIVTREGITAIEQIKVGDQVLTHLGRFRPVLAISQREASDFVTVNAKSLDAITPTPEHPFFALDLTVERKIRDGAGPQRVQAGELRAREYRRVVRAGRRNGEYMEATPSRCHALTLPFVRPEHPVKEIDLREWAKLPGGKKYDFIFDDEVMTSSHHKTQTMRWRQVLDRQFGRVVGLYLAEGASNRYATAWSFNAAEKHLVQEVSDFVENRLGCRCYARRQKNCTIVSANLPLLEEFFEQCGKYAHNKKIPCWVWDAPDEFVDGLLMGYMTGDGYFIEKRKQWIATTVSLSLAWGMRLLALRLGLAAIVTVDRKPGERTIEGRRCATRQVYRVSFFVQPGHKGATLLTNHVAAYSVMRTEKTNIKHEVFNLHVAEDNSYCTTGDLVHNCAEMPKGAHDDLADAMSQALTHMTWRAYAKALI